MRLRFSPPGPLGLSPLIVPLPFAPVNATVLSPTPTPLPTLRLRPPRVAILCLLAPPLLLVLCAGASAVLAQLRRLPRPPPSPLGSSSASWAADQATADRATARRPDPLPDALPEPLTEPLTEEGARRRAETLLARVAVPHAVAVSAIAEVGDSGYGRTRVPGWQVDCDTSDGKYVVRLEARTGQVMSIAPEDRRGTAEDRGDSEDRGDQSSGTYAACVSAGSGVSVVPSALSALSPDRAEALARRYLKLADVVLPSSLGTLRPEMT